MTLSWSLIYEGRCVRRILEGVCSLVGKNSKQTILPSFGRQQVVELRPPQGASLKDKKLAHWCWLTLGTFPLMTW